MLELVMLPATEPGDMTYGELPRVIKGYPLVLITPVVFPHMAWYNREIQSQAVKQIPAISANQRVLVGFSKSGLGAWNITRKNPHLFSATIIFDAPVTMEHLPPWGTEPFYKDNAEWQSDLPARSVGDYKKNMPANHRLILVPGEAFHDQMSLFSEMLLKAGIPHDYLSEKKFKHHWQTGWLEEGLKAVMKR